MHLLLGLWLSVVAGIANAQVQVEAGRALDATHFEFTGQKSWKYEVRKTEDGKVVATLPSLSDAAVEFLKSYKDVFIKSVSVNTNAVDGQTELEFQLSGSNIDYFNYETENPSKLVLDFYAKSNEKAKTANETEKAPEKKAEGSAEKKQAKAKAPGLPKIKIRANGVLVQETDLRKPASTEFIQGDLSEAVPSGAKPRGAFDGADPTFKRFKIEDYEIQPEAIIASRTRLYLNFPFMPSASPYLQKLVENPPEYEITPADTDENKTARLLLTLFKNNRIAVFLKTSKFFIQQYPESPYAEMIQYMTADIYYDLWNKKKDANDFEKAMGLYRMLVERYPKSSLTKRTLFLMAFSYVERGDSFNALKLFQRIERTYKDQALRDSLQLAIADAYINIHQGDKAVKVLEDLESTAQSKAAAADAAYRIGDVHANLKNYKSAAEAYRKAIKKYPEFWETHPSAFFNLAESEFRTANKTESAEEYRKCSEAYRDFLVRFPDHPNGGYALTRLGEVLEILSGPGKKSKGAYFESYFRFKGTPGGALARIRILESRIAQMKEKEFKDASKEIEESRKVLPLDGINDFITVIRADGYYARDKFDTAIEMLIRYYQENPDSTINSLVKSRIVRAITEQIRSELDKGNNLETLRLFTRYQSNWLKDSDRMDLRFYVAKAYEAAGGLSEAEDIYRATLNTLYSVKGTAKETERNVFEKVPELDSLNLRLARISSLKSDYLKASGYLDKIPKIARLSDPEQIERAEIAADVFSARGQNDKAIASLKELSDTWRGQPPLLAPIYLRLANLYHEDKKNSFALAQLDKVVNFYKDSQSVSDAQFAQALEKKADILLSEKKYSESVAVYKEMIDASKDGKNISAVRYRAGKAAFTSGDLKTAESIWSGLDETKDTVWHKLANEQMQGAKWKKDYRKYVDRIPAMAPTPAANPAPAQPEGENNEPK